MLNKINRALACCVGIAALSAGTCAVAQDETNDPATATTATIVARNPLGTKALGLDALGRQRGGTDPGTISDMKLNGVVGNNAASNLTTGNNVISDGAFSGVSGVPLVVQNSGNNVLIQNATIINVQVK